MREAVLQLQVEVDGRLEPGPGMTTNDDGSGGESNETVAS